MQRKYENFDETEMGDGTYYVADPVQPGDEPIRIDTGWFEAQAGEKGDWEYIVGEIVATDLQQDLQLQDEGEGTIERDQAVENVLDADLSGDKTIAGKDQAAAIIDYFIEEGALTQKSNGELVVLQDPIKLTDEDSDLDNKEREYYILSWAATIDACIDYMDDTLQTFEEAKERFNEQKDTVENNDVSEVEKQVARVGQDLKNLGPGADVVSRSEVPADKKERYDTLKEDFTYFQALYEVKKQKLVTAEKGIENLRRNINRLKGAKDVYEDKVGEMRKAALNEQVFPSEDVEVAQNMADLITTLGGVENPSQKAEQMDAEDLSNQVSETLGEIDDIVDTVEEGMEEEEKEKIESTIQMEE